MNDIFTKRRPQQQLSAAGAKRPQPATASRILSLNGDEAKPHLRRWIRGHAASNDGDQPACPHKRRDAMFEASKPTISQPRM